MSARNTRLATVGILVLVLGAGFLIGLAWERERGLAAAEPEPTAVATEESSSEAGERRGLIVERVGLSGDQQILVDSIVEHHRELMRVLRTDYRTGHRALIDSTRVALKSTLTPEQAIQYDSLLADFDRSREEEQRREQEEERQDSQDDSQH